MTTNNFRPLFNTSIQYPKLHIVKPGTDPEISAIKFSEIYRVNIVDYMHFNEILVNEKNQHSGNIPHES